jgi:hypothetical protein
MTSVRLSLIAAVGVLLTISPALAEDLSHYRNFVLESNVNAVITASGARPAAVKVLYERPARIQELDWRPGYGSVVDLRPDPVRQLTFSFVDNALYQIVVTYDRSRTDALTNADLIESLTATYGAPAPAAARLRSRTSPDETQPAGIVVAYWETAAASVTLFRGSYTPELQLVLVSKPLGARALATIRESKRLDVLEAPQRAIEQRRKEAADADAAREKTRSTNKGAFRP